MMLQFQKRFLLFTSAFLLCLLAAQHSAAQTPVYGYKVVARIPHPTSSFTEGFFYRDGLFYESSGLNGASSLMVIDPNTGTVLEKHDLDPKYFGEGIVDWGPYIYQWTWQSHVGFIYDRTTLAVKKQFTYDGEGWGMTHNATELITSNGSSTLSFRNPDTFKVTHRISVSDHGKPIKNLNELEWIHNEIYANIWHSNRIARISPTDGHVITWIDLTGILPIVVHVDEEGVLNGIAYDERNDRLFVTGKKWPTIFEIKLAPPIATKQK